MLPIHLPPARFLATKAARSALRLVPGTGALALRRDLRDQTRLRKADFALVSFPKSGRTFVRVMLSHLFHLKYGTDPHRLIGFANFHKINPAIPRILFTHDGDAMRPPHRIPRDKSRYRDTPVIVLARHPGDVAVSRYHHLKHRSKDLGRRTLARLPIEEFVWCRNGGIPSIVAFLNGWAAAVDVLPSVSMFRFEDFRADPAPTLQALAAALGIGASADDIDKAVAFARFDSLQEKERSGYFASSRLGARQDANAASLKVRSGRSGGYRTALGVSEVDRIDRYLRTELSPIFGYSDPVR